MLDLKGRGAIVAGTRRIGATVVERLAREGVNLAVVYRSSHDVADRLHASIRDRVERACIIQADLSSPQDVQRLVDEALRQLGNVSFCVDAASDYPRTPWSSLTAADWDHAMASAKGAYLLALASGRAMQGNAGPTRGHIVFFGDWAAEETPYRDFLPYLTAKAAVHFMTRAFALELAPHGILVNTISPGPTMQDPSLVSSPEWKAALAQTPLHRESSADEMAEMVATLLRLETVTGENIRIDSGRHIAGTALRDRDRVR
jgi:NAD(P)-dependent dehydrogenase (short-subunit alcohol dehydrogenase family)